LEIGLAGEFVAGRYLLRQGARKLSQIKNQSGQGIDLTGIADDVRMFFDVKASRGLRAPGLAPAQRNMARFVQSRLQLAAGFVRDPYWRKVSGVTRSLAAELFNDINIGALIPEGRVINVTNLSGWRAVITARGW
jgi:hypothetical protein